MHILYCYKLYQNYHAIYLNYNQFNIYNIHHFIFYIFKRYLKKMANILSFLFQKQIFVLKNGQKKCPKIKILDLDLKKPFPDCIF